MIHLFCKTSHCVRVHSDSGPSHPCWLVTSVTKAFQYRYRRLLCRRHTSKSKSQLRQWMSKIRADVFSWIFEGSHKNSTYIVCMSKMARKRNERSFSPPDPDDAADASTSTPAPARADDSGALSRCFLVSFLFLEGPLQKVPHPKNG